MGWAPLPGGRLLWRTAGTDLTGEDQDSVDSSRREKEENGWNECSGVARFDLGGHRGRDCDTDKCAHCFPLFSVGLDGEGSDSSFSKNILCWNGRERCCSDGPTQQYGLKQA